MSDKTLPRIIRLAQCLLVTAFLSAPLAVLAQGSTGLLGLRSHPAAERRHEIELLEALKLNCPSESRQGLLNRPEINKLRNGAVWLSYDAKDISRYSIFVFNHDLRQFTLIDGQRLRALSKVAVPLALPRDYARCRFVQDSAEVEVLEVVHTDQVRQGELLRAASAFEDAVKSAQCTKAAKSMWLVQDGTRKPMMTCEDLPGAPQERIKDAWRRTFER